MERVILLGDPTRSLGSLAEPECIRIIDALDLAEHLQIPCEWFALSAGAKIAMDSGTENMDWVAAVLRRIVRFTQAGGEINVVVSGINVGAQPYWNAEATMLMHTKGILVMTPESAMVLTGKQALDYSGGVSAEDNFGIGGQERIMGPNGQAQYRASDIAGACEVLLRYYEHAYVAPGERFPRRAETTDPADRDVRPSPHEAPGSDLETVGQIFAQETNPGRKKPFDIRSVMGAVIDSDLPPLERWKGMHEAEVAVTWDAHLGGWPVSLLGIESRPVPRHGPVPADGPDQWTSGTLFPLASKKIARAINAASGSRPLVMLANLAGFDGSPESMREAAARIRRRDRARRRQLRRTDRVLRDLALPRRRVRGVLPRAEREPRIERDRGRIRLGDRGRAGGRRRVHPGGRSPDAHRPADRRARRAHRGRPKPLNVNGCAPNATPSTQRCARASLESSQPSLTLSTASSAPSRSGRSSGSSTRAICGRT